MIGNIRLCFHIDGCNVSILPCYIKGIRCNLLFFFCSTLLCLGVVLLCFLELIQSLRFDFYGIDTILFRCLIGLNILPQLLEVDSTCTTQRLFHLINSINQRLLACLVGVIKLISPDIFLCFFQSRFNHIREHGTKLSKHCNPINIGFNNFGLFILNSNITLFLQQFDLRTVSPTFFLSFLYLFRILLGDGQLLLLKRTIFFQIII